MAGWFCNICRRNFSWIPPVRDPNGKDRPQTRPSECPNCLIPDFGGSDPTIDATDG